MKNNKGFTLVELLAAIVIIAILGAIAVVNFTGFLSNTQEKVFTTYEESMKSATIEYIIDTGNIPTSSTPVCVKLQTLTTGDTVTKSPAYLDEFANPNSDDKCITNSYVYVEVDPENENRNKTDDQGRTDNNKKFIYKVCLSCNNYKSEDCSKVTDLQISKYCK